jgi:YD repeat-containing protein
MILAVYNRLKALRLLMLASLLGLGGALSAVAADETFDAHGFNANRDFFSQLPYEHIDPLTGNLVLTFTDLVLPGNAGLDLKIQRTYNSKIYADFATQGDTPAEDSWAGLGWSLHLGRILNPTSANPIAEMPDGSRHKLFLQNDASGKLITRDFWLYDKNQNPPVLFLPNGLTYAFGQSVTISGVPMRLVTRIQDPFGNHIDVQYMTSPQDGIQSITQDLGGGQVRTVTFTTGGVGASLQTMTYSTGTRTYTWNYTQSDTSGFAGHTLLTVATPPVGPPWRYGYNGTSPRKNELTSVEPPNGGKVTYSYVSQDFQIGSTFNVRSPVVSQRQTWNRGNVLMGTWDYLYAQGTEKDQTIVNGPCSTTTYKFLGVGNFVTPGAAWKVGLMTSRTLSDASGTLETESISWQASVAISANTETIGGNFDAGIFVPLFQSRAVTRGPQTFTTTYTYNTSNYNDYGRASTIQEIGDLSRTTNRTFRYGFTPYIKDRLDSETLTVGTESFTNSYGYNLVNGFKTSETIRGITTSFSPLANGNVASATNANVHTTSYLYLWGRQSSVTTPMYAPMISRTINPEGTIATETRRGFTTSFGYDLLFRPTSKTPPTGDACTTTYDNAGGTTITVTRGSSSVVTSLDGLGRSTGTSDSQGVKTSIGYDNCGRRNYVSYPFTGTSNIGSSYTFDGFDRVTQKSNPDGTTVGYSYNGIDVTITDENHHATTQNWSGYGSPDEAVLSSVTDAAQNTTQYSYDALGSLTQVSPPTGGARTFTYYAAGQSGGTPGLLKTEQHSESGTVTYTYLAAGNLRTRTDAKGQQTTYSYDANERLTLEDRAGTDYDATIDYDASDNRTLLQNAYVRSTFGYDANNNLQTRTDVTGGRTFTTGYVYWPSDALRWIDYPSGRRAYYTYDSENRIQSVANNSPATVTYADQFSYHPSGAVASFKPGGAGSPLPAQTLTYHAQRYWLTGINTGLRSLTYGYAGDSVGNIRSITDSRGGSMNRSFTYDALDRLSTVTGFGAGTYTYDSIGNRTNDPVVGSSGWTYASNRLTSAGPAGSFAYDSNGNVTSDGSRTYTYTPADMVKTVSGLEYRYDGDNQRTLKVDAGGNRYFIHGPGGQILSEFADSCTGATNIRDYVYAGPRLLASVEPNSPTLTLTGPSNILESAGSATFTVTLHTSAPLTQAVTFNYGALAGTATAGSDFSLTGGAASFPVNSVNGATFNIVVSIVGDTSVEANETFSVQISNACHGIIAEPVQAATIEDDDAIVQLTASAVSVSESAGVLTIAVKAVTTNAKPIVNTVTVNYSVTSNTAVDGLDFTGSSGVLTWNAGEVSGTQRTFQIPIIEDTLNECGEFFTVGLQNAQGGSMGLSGETVTITDNDLPPVWFAGNALTVDESAGSTAHFTVMAGPHCAPASVTVSTGPAATASATADVDYVSTSTVLSLPASTGTTSTDFAVPILDDTADEPNEAFIATMSSADAIVVEPSKAQAVIRDNDGRAATCEPITFLPFKITAQGNYCFRGSQSVNISSGNAITIETDYVTIDLGGFKLGGGAGGPATLANGIYALNRKNIVIRNGNIRGFYRGVFIQDTSGYSAGHMMEGISADENTNAGIWVEGTGSIIRGNAVLNTGLGAVGPSSDVFGIVARGVGPRLIENAVTNTWVVGTGRAVAMSVSQAPGAVALSNRAVNDVVAGSTGIEVVNSSSGVLLIANDVAGTEKGLFYDATSSGKYRDNTTAGVTVPFTGGLDQGKNN